MSEEATVETSQEVAPKSNGKSLVLLHSFDNHIESMRKAGVGFSATGLTFEKGITDVNASKIGALLIRMDQVVGVGMNFWLGDWFNWVQKTFPRKASQIIEGMPEYKYETVKNYGSVANAIPGEFRSPNLTWTFYTKLAPCTASFIAENLKNFKEGSLEYDAFVLAVDAEQKKRIEADKKKRAKEEKAKQKAASGTENASEAEDGQEDTEDESAPQTTAEAKIGTVVLKSTFDMIEATKRFIMKATKTKSKPTDAETIDFVFKRFCGANKIRVKGELISGSDTPMPGEESAEEEAEG